MDSDNSSDNNSSTDSSTESSDDDEKLEAAQVCGVKIKLPQGLCERKDVFDEFFSVHTWNALSEIDRQHLKSFLPSFPENDEEEKNITLHKLFKGEDFRFGKNPLEHFHENLKAGNYRPDIAKMRLTIRKAERKEEKFRYRKYREYLKNDVITSRQKLLTLARNLPPGFEPKVQSNNPAYYQPASHRTRKRYFQELAAVRAQVEESGFSSDENYPEGPCMPLPRKQRRHLNNIKNLNPLGNENVFMSTLSTKSLGLDLERHINPNINPFFITEDSYKTLIRNHAKRRIEYKDDLDYDTRGLSITEIISRTKLPYIKKVNNTPVSSFSPKQNVETKTVQRKKIKKEPHHLSNNNNYSSELISKTNPFFGHSSNSDSDSDSFLDSFVSSSPSSSIAVKNKLKKVNSRHHHHHHRHHHRTLSKNSKLSPFTTASSTAITSTTTATTTISSNSSGGGNVKLSSVKVSPTPIADAAVSESRSFNDDFKPSNSFGKMTPATLSDLDGIDMMNLPIDLEGSHIDILEINNRPELMQETHANFLSLIRDIICSTNEHRMNLKSLEERLKSWQENPISPLNDWYSYVDNWVSILPSAINFLSGSFQDQLQDFVPYIEFKPQLDMYQWIGAGRDSDSLLMPLFRFWIDRRNEMKSTAPIKEENLEVSDRSQTPPPPRCPTNWTVRKADPDEVKAFQEQERKRYDSPHKAFTYRCNGYESIVGPVKGIYSNQNLGVSKARGHSMLTTDRPNFVTILTLVRDAAARLPNGEGTRAEICQLLKSSQYIQSNVPENVLQSVVSGALDRMHTQFDPCVKYDPKRKVWIYLHRNRSEQDFERIHQQSQGITKTPKKIIAKNKTPNTKTPKPTKSEKPCVKPSRSTPEVTVEEEAVNEPSSVPNNDPQPKLTPIVKPERKVPVNVPPKTVPAAKPTGTSILLSKQQDKTVSQRELEDVSPAQMLLSPSRASPSKQVVRTVQDRKEINETIQALIHQRVSSPVAKHITNPRTGKSLVKIISPNPGKSIIIPSSGSPRLKQTEQQHRRTPTKEIVTQQQQQQFIQTLTINSQQQQQQKTAEPKVKVSNIQGEVLQTFTSQQLQNIKNITVLRNPNQAQQQQQHFANVEIDAGLISSPGSESTPPVISISSSPESDTQEQQQQKQIHRSSPKVQTLTLAQQHQILQTLKQKAVPVQQTVLCSPRVTGGVAKQQRTTVGQVIKQAAATGGASLLNQNKLSATENIQGKPVLSTSQPPLVAKVLTNAAGQVISVESLLTQKQLSQALRIASPKGGQPNIIQLTSASAHQTPMAQFAVGSSNSVTAFPNQLKLVISTTPAVITATSTITTSKTVAKNNARTHTTTTTTRYNTPKVTQQQQQITGATKIMKNVTPQQIKIPVNAKNVVVSKPMTVNASSVRMVSTNSLSLAQLSGKPLILANKGTSSSSGHQGIPVSNVLIQTQPGAGGSGGGGAAAAAAATLILTNATAKATSNTNVSSSAATLGPGQQVIISPQLKMQQSQQVVLGSGAKAAAVTIGQNNQASPIVLGQTVRLQQSSSPAGGTQRLVVASQNQGGQIVAQQILLPVGFQGTALNIKTLQGVKVVPLAQTTQGRGVQGRQVLARVVNPGSLFQVNQPQSTTDITNSTAE